MDQKVTTMKRTAIALGLLLALSAGSVSFAQTTPSSSASAGAATFGTMSQEEFDRINKEGAAKVQAIKPTNAPLSTADQKLMMQVAKGGMMQLAVSQLAADNVTDEQVRKLAESEVEEQTGLSAKLKEIAAAKGITLPAAPDPQTDALLTKMKAMSGAELDRFYVQESGVKGHEKLDKVMSSVKSGAKDAALKSLAAAAHPLVKTHLTVSRAMLGKMPAGSSTEAAGNSGNN
jgi:putative membrane protein